MDIEASRQLLKLTTSILKRLLWSFKSPTQIQKTTGTSFPQEEVGGRRLWRAERDPESDISLQTSEAHWFHLRFICQIHPYSAATIHAASHDETIMIQALGYTSIILNALYLGTFSALKQSMCEILA